MNLVRHEIWRARRDATLHWAHCAEKRAAAARERGDEAAAIEHERAAAVERENARLAQEQLDAAAT
jgi:hypothetical protein